MALGLLGLARDKRLRERPARLVAARAAVELVGLGGLPHAGERLRYRLLAGLGLDERVGRVRRRSARLVAPPRARLERRAGVCREQRRERSAVGRHRGPVDASAGAGQNLKEKLPPAGRAEAAAEHPPEVVEPRDAYEPHAGSAVAQGVVHAALDGIEASFLGGAERELGFFVERNALFRQKLLERREYAGECEQVRVRVGLVLLRGARAEEDDLRVVPELLLEKRGVRAHGRREGRDEFRVGGEIPADHVHRRRAGARYDERVFGLGEDLRDAGAHGLCAVRRFAHPGEAELPEGRRHLPYRDALEVASETRRHGRVDFRARRQELLEPGEVASYLLRVGGAHLHAFAAGDACFGYHRSLAVDDAYRLDGAVPDALVAVLALVLDREYRGVHVLGKVFSRMSAITPRSTFL